MNESDDFSETLRRFEETNILLKQNDKYNDQCSLSPDPVMHLQISLIKSVVRIVAGVCLFAAGIFGDSSYIAFAGGALVIAEFLGIYEELV